MKEDFYEILGIDKSASSAEIKKLIVKKLSNIIQIKILEIKMQKQILKKQLKHTRF